MKNLLNKEHCCYKIYTLFTKSIDYSHLLSLDSPLYMDYPPPMIFQKSQPPLWIKVGQSYYVISP